MKQTVSIIVLLILSIASIGVVMGYSDQGEHDDDERYEHSNKSENRHDNQPRGGWLESRADISPVDNELYSAECGSCHFAYPPGLLPQAAWQQIMGALDEHFGDDASLDEQQATQIRNYLVNNAADRSGQSRSRAFAAGSNGSGPLPRITETHYFLKEHDEIPARLVQGNKDVGSFSNCQACHRSADQGVFNEHQVSIPGYGRWDD